MPLQKIVKKGSNEMSAPRCHFLNLVVCSKIALAMDGIRIIYVKGPN